MELQKIIRDNFTEAQEVLKAFLSDDKNIESIAAAATMMAKSIQQGGKIISCGNGGSMCDAMHFAEELSGKFRGERRPLPAVAVSDPSHITCVANDYGFAEVFSRYVEAFGKKGDVLLAISTSGNSENILRAAAKAKELSIQVVGLTGKDGGKLSAYCDAEIRVIHKGYSDRIQEVHIKVIHSLIHAIESKL